MYAAESTEEFDTQYAYWQRKDPKKVLKINALIKNCCQTPYNGIGKPEPLKHKYTGKWSRRIDREHRLVYGVVGDTIILYACRYHYK